MTTYSSIDNLSKYGVGTQSPTVGQMEKATFSSGDFELKPVLVGSFDHLDT